MGGHKTVRELATDKVGKAAAKGKDLSKERAAEVRTELRAKGGKALEGSVESARHVATGARRNKARLASAAAAAVAAVLAVRRIVRRRRAQSD